MKDIIKKIFEIFISISALFGLIMMYDVLTKGKSGIDLKNAIIDYFTYFTMLSNILVFIIFTVMLFFQEKINEKLFDYSIIYGAVISYISFTGIIFFLFLREIYNNMGMEFEIAKVLLHYVVPITCVLYWIIYLSSKNYKLIYVLYWYIFPFCYTCTILLRGCITSKYPYPFTDVLKYGYIHVLINNIFMSLIFFAIGFCLIMIGKVKRSTLKKI